MKQLQHLLAKEDTVIFVGSGVSRWAGLPSWEGLVDKLSNFLTDQGCDPSLVRQEAKDGDLLQAASYGVAKLSVTQFGEFIRYNCQTGAIEPVSIHEVIMELGPTCFITTNYDDLVEQAFRRWRKNPSEPRIVLNRQPVDQADIVQATTRNFIFKPHGDARDTESIVLTREQYRMLMPEGKFSATLPTLQNLLASRPVLFVGFGLRDPDFLYVRDLLANIYRGGMRDHYAIVADPVADQINWWRDNYGVHLVGYETQAAANGRRDHSALIDLLVDASRASAKAVQLVPTFDLTDPALILALARYGAGNIAPDSTSRFDIRVAAQKRDRSSGRRADVDQYDYWTAERLLRDGPQRLVLTGAPGAGKSFAIRHAVNSLANSLQDACLTGKLTDATKVPVFVDLKLYEGDLAALISKHFPPQLDFQLLRAALPTVLFLDGFNELPREYRESSAFDAELDALLLANPDLRIVISSRTSDGLTRLEIPIYELSDIPEKEVDRLLLERNIIIPEMRRHDIKDVLQRPFYFRMFEQAAISLDNVAGPADIYSQYLSHVSRRFASEFGDGIDLIQALERYAYQALEAGSEATRVDELSTTLRFVAPNLDARSVDEIINWLIRNQLLIPLGGMRSAFIHQSVTEYLAARKLATHLMDARSPIAELIVLRRWDNVIFLTLGMLNAGSARILLQQIINIDLEFAIQSARFVEENRDSLIAMLLGELLLNPSSIPRSLYRSRFNLLPFSAQHEKLLRRVANELPSLRTEAVRALARILGTAYKPELVKMLFDAEANWAMRRAVGALGSLIEPDDVKGLIERALSWDPILLNDERSGTSNRIDALAKALKPLPDDVIEREVFARIAHVDEPQKKLLAALIATIATDKKSDHGLQMLIKLSKDKLLLSLFPLYLTINYDSARLAFFIGKFEDSLLDAVIFYITSGDKWSVSLLRTACANSSVISSIVSAAAQLKAGLPREVLVYCATGAESPFFDWLNALSIAPTEKSIAPEIKLIDLNELDWTAHHDLLVALLKRRDPALALALLGGSIPVEIKGLSALDMGDAEPWITWMIELFNTRPNESSGDENLFWLASQLSFLIAHSSAPGSQAQLLALLEHGDPRMRWAISHKIMPHMEGLTLRDLSRQSVAILIDLLRGHRFSEFSPHIFSYIADEAFIREHLLPLAANGEAETRDNIADIIDTAGRRLGLRFVLSPVAE